MKFEKLFSSIIVKSVHLKNRIVFPAIGTNFATKEGKVTNQMIEHYEVRAKGGAGLLILEASAIDFWAKHRDTDLCIYDDSFLPGLSALVSKIHSHGAAVALQLVFPGRTQKAKYAKDGQPWAPSAIPIPHHPMPKEMNIEEIKYIIGKFAEATKRAKDAGFDAVEFHGAHGLVHHQFFSPRSNLRIDEYGGSLENRMRFALETVSSARKLVGNNYPLIFRLSAFEGIDGGYKFEDVLKFSKRLENEGIDILSVSAGSTETLDSISYAIQTAEISRGFLADYSQEIKKEIKIPVSVAGRINGPEIAEKILLHQKADLVCIGRSLLVDPELPNKAKTGEMVSIRRCTACNFCLGKLRGGELIECAQNPFLGREKEALISKTRKKKKIIVVGGGPAGMEAAIIAKKRGHDVILYEKERKLGGQLNWSVKLPNKEFKLLLDYQKNLVKFLGIPTHLGVKLTADSIKENNPDALIMATGSKPRIPKIPGVKEKNVLTFLEAIDSPEKVGKTVVIIGGGLISAQTAEFLAYHSKKVVIILYRRKDIAKDINPFARAVLVNNLKKYEVKIMKSVLVKRILQDGIIVEGAKGKENKLECETVILATGAERCQEPLASVVEKDIKAIYSVGDCISPRKLDNAIHEATLTALKI